METRAALGLLLSFPNVNLVGEVVARLGGAIVRKDLDEVITEISALNVALNALGTQLDCAAHQAVTVLAKFVAEYQAPEALAPARLYHAADKN